MTTEDYTIERDSRNLFKSMSIEDVSKKNDLLKQDIEEKKRELRKLVGTRYRNLIDAADSIITMRELSSELMKVEKGIDDNHVLLSNSRRSQLLKSNEHVSISLSFGLQQNEKEHNRRMKLEVGKKIKTLMDTPESIWSAIEEENFEKATMLYLQAEKIYRDLNKLGSYSSKLTSAIPLLQRQWTTITQFPPKILNNSRSFLLSNSRSSHEFGGALSGIWLLERKEMIVVFKEFLSTRLKSLSSLLSSDGEISTILISALELIFETLSQTVELFWSEGKESVVEEIVNSIQKHLSNDSDSISNPSPDLVSKTNPIQPKDLSSFSKSFFDSARSELWSGGKKLLGKIEKAAKVKEIEELVHDSINKMEKEGKKDFPKQHRERVKWSTACGMLVGSYDGIWSLVSSLFNQSKLSIIQNSFTSLSLSQPLNSALSLLAASKADWSVGEYVWGDVGKEEGEKWKEVKKRTDALSNELNFFLNSLDSQLLSIHNDLSPILSPNNTDAEEMWKGVGKGVLGLVSEICNEFGKKLRSSQDLITKHFLSGNSSLAGVWREVEGAMMVGRLSRTIYTNCTQLRNLFVLYHNHTNHSNNFNSTTPNLKMTTSRKIIRPSSRMALMSVGLRENVESELFTKSKELLRKEYLYGSALWVFWVVNESISSFQSSLYREKWNEPQRRNVWPTTTLALEQSEKIRLPLSPSAFVIKFLYRISWEIERVGGHVVEKVVLQYLVYALAEKLMEVYNRFLADKLPRNKEGVVQLLFDVRFLFEVLSWRKDLENASQLKELRQTLLTIKQIHSTQQEQSSSTQNGNQQQQSNSASAIEGGAEIEAVMEWNKKVNNLVNDFEKELDPIDVAFYQKHIKEAVSKCLVRYQVLLGFLMLSKPTSSSTTTTSSGQNKGELPKTSTVPEQHNLLVIAPVSSRFSLLPISIPPKPTTSQQQHHQHHNSTPFNSNSFSNEFIPQSPAPPKKPNASNQQQSELQNLWFI